MKALSFFISQVLRKKYYIYKCFFSVGSMHELLVKPWRDSENTWIIEFYIR